jgi:hypothetical protein
MICYLYNSWIYNIEHERMLKSIECRKKKKTQPRCSMAASPCSYERKNIISACLHLIYTE